jgi:hypothetical protein
VTGFDNRPAFPPHFHGFDQAPARDNVLKQHTFTHIMLRNYNEREDYAIRRMNEALRRFTQPGSSADGRVNAARWTVAWSQLAIHYASIRKRNG